MKIGIHSKDWEKLIEDLRNNFEEYTFNRILIILEKHTTRYVK